MPLGQDLARRYAALFAGYGEGGVELLVWTKGEIVRRRDRLRDDAMYFLVVSLDHMVIKPLSGYLPAPGNAFGQPLDAPFSGDEVRRMLEAALSIIVDGAERDSADGKISANGVIRAISVHSEAISEVVTWWRET